MHTEPNKSLFYSGPKIQDVQYKHRAKVYAAKHGLKFIENCFQDIEWQQFDYDTSGHIAIADKKKFWDYASQGDG